MLASLGQVIQEPGKGGLIHFFQLGLHIADIRGKFQLQAVIEVNFVSGIDVGFHSLEAVPYAIKLGVAFR